MGKQESLQPVIAAAVEFARQVHADDTAGHDWWHVYRVWRMAQRLAAEEGADSMICELAALLHDVADEKLNTSEAAGLARVKDWLDVQPLSPAEAEHVYQIVATLSFKGGGGAPMATLEGAIVRDADRLDALGAQGIARVFAYSGAKGQAIHDPELPPRTHMTREEYRHGRSTAINHFHEKLLKLKEGIVTPTAQRLALARHDYMQQFLERFAAEWTGRQ